MEFISAKTIVNQTKNNFWFGCDLNMNIYKGCSHGCIYCDSRSDCYFVEEFDRVRAKENALMIIRNDLRKKIKKGVVCTGAMSDPYNPFEKQLELTRHSLELLNAFEFGVAIATKSPLITRDIDVLKDIAQHSPVIAKITITTSDEQICKKIEQNVASPKKRFEAIEKLAQNNLYCGVLMTPILPFINDTKQNIIQIVTTAKQSGAKFVYPSFGVTLRANQRQHFYDKIDESFPKIKEKYIKYYGQKYICSSFNAKTLYYTFANECEKHGLLFKMKDIVKSYKRGYASPSQLSFFL